MLDLVTISLLSCVVAVPSGLLTVSHNGLNQAVLASFNHGLMLKFPSSVYCKDINR